MTFARVSEKLKWYLNSVSLLFFELVRLSSYEIFEKKKSIYLARFSRELFVPSFVVIYSNQIIGTEMDLIRGPEASDVS